MLNVTIAKVARGGGRIHVRFANKQGVGFASAQEVLDIVDDAKARITQEVLAALALKSVGAANADTLEGKTITLSIDVVIS